MYGLLGKKLGHSFSPPIHRALTGNAYPYELIEVEPEALESFLRERSFNGLNVTIPYKRDVIPYLNELSAAAEKIGAVNTIVRRGDRLIGDNTDYDGVKYTFARSGVDVAGKRALILGNGATSLTVATVLRDLGVASIRNVTRQGPLTYEMLNGLCSETEDAQLLINTTPVGMYPNTDGELVDLILFPKLEFVFDVVYNPLATRLVQSARAGGIRYSNGLPMLVAQAKAAAERFLERSIPDTEIERVIDEITGDLRNIVLVGMPGSGKTTIGREVASLLGKEFVDLDEAIEARAGMTIPEIFRTQGETSFRDLEAALCLEYGQGNRRVLATGGGAVIRAENRQNLRMNGVGVFLTRDLDDLPLDGRPVSQAATSLSALYETRLSFYQACSDVTVANDDEPAVVAKRIVERLRELRLSTQSVKCGDEKVG